MPHNYMVFYNDLKLLHINNSHNKTNFWKFTYAHYGYYLIYTLIILTLYDIIRNKKTLIMTWTFQNSMNMEYYN